MTTQTQTPQRQLDLRASAWLLFATAAGTIVTCIDLIAAQEGFTWMDIDAPLALIAFLYAAIPAVLIFIAYLAVRRFEDSAGARSHSGALALLAGLAALAVPFTMSWWASPIYGVALLLLTIRTRIAVTAACGVLTLAVWWFAGFSATPALALPSVALATIACAGAGVQQFLASRQAEPED